MPVTMPMMMAKAPMRARMRMIGSTQLAGRQFALGRQTYPWSPTKNSFSVFEQPHQNASSVNLPEGSAAARGGERERALLDMLPGQTGRAVEPRSQAD